LTESRWHEVWSRHGVERDVEAGSLLAGMLAADGFDTGFGSITEDAWIDFVSRTCDRLELRPGDSLFEVGCGSGAFLYPASVAGIDVGGIDYSERLVEDARRAMPDGHFAVAEAAALDTQPAVDAVVACSVFFYFPSHEYAEIVIRRMARKAIRAVAVLDVPDLATAAEALAGRQERLGGAAAYAERYGGLDHLSFDREWMAEAMRDAGLTDIVIEDQQIADYANAKYRFNVFARVP
jgi:SAM-dependent methyltransferase